MRLKITKEAREAYSDKLLALYKDFGYDGSRDSIPSKLISSSDYKKLMKEVLKEIISNNVVEGDDNTDIYNMNTSNPEQERTFDDNVELAKDFLIGMDLKRSDKNRLYPNVTQVPINDLDVYRKELMIIMINGDMVKKSMNDKKWLKKWANVLTKWDRKGIKDLAKASTQKSGIAGFFEKRRNTRAVRKQNPSPINAQGLNAILNEMIDGSNLAQLTPQIYKSFNIAKTTKIAPKINQVKEENTEA